MLINEKVKKLVEKFEILEKLENIESSKRLKSQKIWKALWKYIRLC